MNPPRVLGPDGGEWPLPPPASEKQSLAEWLEANGHLLNTRCGKRGLCRGCRLETPTGEALAACQQSVGAWLGAVLRVPAASIRDATLSGVTAFELDPLAPGSATWPGGPGIALDVGTTTLAAALWTGDPPRCAAIASRANPQIRFGDNVVSRVQFARENPRGLAQLHQCLLKEGVGPLIAELTEKAGLSPDRLTGVTVAGNPVMLHTLANASLDGFAAYPFRPVFLEERRLDGEPMRLACEVRLLPGPGPFVGSDVLGGAVANGFFQGDGVRLLIDFGTNGEILLRDATGRTWCTATAAGPAFEGGRLGCGAVAGPGVIGRLAVDGAGHWALPGDTVPWRGMAGAAYVDFMAIGRRQGWLGPMGRFTPEAETRLRLSDGVSVSEADIAELLQAKAAIQAGWSTLLECAGLTVSDLDQVVVAGGFGYHLTPAHAMGIGLLPPVDPDRIHLAGNASLAGASLALLHPEEGQRWRNHCREMEVVELNRVSGFEDHFIDAMSFDPPS